MNWPTLTVVDSLKLLERAFDDEDQDATFEVIARLAGISLDDVEAGLGEIAKAGGGEDEPGTHDAGQPAEGGVTG